MKIGIIGSMQFTDKMLEIKAELNNLGHEAFITDLHKPMIGKNAEEIEKIKIKHKNEDDAIRVFWRMMQGADAVLVLNYKNYLFELKGPKQKLKVHLQLMSLYQIQTFYDK